MSLRSLLPKAGLAIFIRWSVRYLFGRRGQRRVAGLRLFYRLRTLVILHSADPIGRLTRVPEIRLWVDGVAAFARLEKLIRRARHSIVIQMFIWKDDDTGRMVARRLLEAADRGIHIDITKDSVGDIFELRGDFVGTKNSIHPLWKRFWSHPNIHITYGTQRDHAKVYVIDDQTLLLTGMNIADEYHYDWHDYMVEIRGQAFVEQYLTRQSAPARAQVRLVVNTEESCEMRSVLLSLLREARQSVVAEHCYLSDPEVIEECIRLSHRGVHVTFILPERLDFHHHANMLAVGRLLAEADRSFMRILLYPGMIHAKIVLIDSQKAFLGSANLMRSSLDDMGEVNVLIQSRTRALHRLQETLRADILRSRAISSTPPFLWVSRWLAWLGL